MSGLADVVRAYADGSQGPEGRHSGIGIAFADSAGEILALRRPVSRSLSTVALEWLAVCYALEVAAEMSYSQIVVYCDNALVVRIINEALDEPDAISNAYASDVLEQMARFREVSVLWIPRHRNVRAHNLAYSATWQPREDVWSPIWREEAQQ